MAEATHHDAVHVLNAALEQEPQAISGLFRHRYAFNVAAFAEGQMTDPTVVDDGYMGIGFIGLLNAIFGTDSDRIAIVADADFYENADKLIESFVATDDFDDGHED